MCRLLTPRSIWEEFFIKTGCIPADRGEDQQMRNREELTQELEDIATELTKHFMENIKNTNIDARMDASFGLVMYAISVPFELANLPSHLLPSGRSLLRTIVEVFVTLSFLRSKDDQTIWLQYRNYGNGQTALAFLKTIDLEEAPDFIDMKRLEILANEDAWFESKDINIGAWADKNLRAMAQEAGVKDVYDQYYDWTSGFVHGHWGAVRDSVFTTCLNPLHRLHRIPRSLQPMPSVLADCCKLKLSNRLLDELNTLYPSFKPRIRWHKPPQE